MTDVTETVGEDTAMEVHTTPRTSSNNPAVLVQDEGPQHSAISPHTEINLPEDLSSDPDSTFSLAMWLCASDFMT